LDGAVGGLQIGSQSSQGGAVELEGLHGFAADSVEPAIDDGHHQLIFARCDAIERAQ